MFLLYQKEKLIRFFGLNKGNNISLRLIHKILLTSKQKECIVISHPKRLVKKKLARKTKVKRAKHLPDLGSFNDEFRKILSPSD